MKKKILAILLSAAMVFSYTAPIYAADDDIIGERIGTEELDLNANTESDSDTEDNIDQADSQDNKEVIEPDIPPDNDSNVNSAPQTGDDTTDNITPSLQPDSEKTDTEPQPDTTPEEENSSDLSEEEVSLESDKKIMEWKWFYKDASKQQDKDLPKLEYIKEKEEWTLNLSKQEEELYDLEEITNLLPKKLEVTLNGEKDTQQINILKWHSENYIKAEDKSWPQEGKYDFTAELEKGYVIDDSIKVTVILAKEKTETKTDNSKSIESETKKENEIQLLSNSNTITVGSWSYTISDGTATIHSYNGSASSVTVPSSLSYGGTTYKLRKIEKSAFENNFSLKSITLPESITSLGSCVFKNCVNLSSVTINGNLGDFNYSSASGSSYYNSVFYNAGTNTSSFKVIFGPTVKRIPSYLFATDSSENNNEFARITSLVISDNVTEIGESAFYNCYKLSSISWGKGLKNIEASAFRNNTSLKSLSLPSKTTIIDSYAFEGCTYLKTVTLPKSTTSLGSCVFKNCTNLSALTINGNIGDHDYSSVNGSSPYNSVFYNTGTNSPSFKVTFTSSVKRIPAFLFATGDPKSDGKYAQITSLVIPNSVSEIGEHAFYNCYDLSNITWGSGLKILNEYAFQNNTSLKSVNLPSKLTTIANSAFEGCTDLKTVVLPKATTSLGKCVFKNCINLSSITINGNMGDHDYSSVSGSSPYNSVFYNAGTNASSFKVIFGSSVTRIPAYIFATNSTGSDDKYAHITSVTIPSSVKSIGTYAFYNCYRLSSATVSSKSAVAEENAFKNCKSSLTFKCYYYASIVTYAKNNKYKISYLDLPKVTISGSSNYSSGIKIAWKKVSSASGYYVYRRTTNGSYSKIKTINKNSTLSWTDTTVKSKNGTTYYYLVKAYSSGKVSGSATGKKIVRMTNPAISSLSNKSGKKIYVKWSKNTKATGYQIQYSTSKTFAKGNKTSTVSGNKNITKTIGSLSKGKTYYVRVRSYKSVSGTKYYSAWSSSKSVKINK